MKFRRLVSENDEMFEVAMALYRDSFPTHEQREESSQARILAWGDYHFDLIYEDDSFAGIILYWETEDFIYVEHFCISREKRNQRLGQKALELLGARGKTVILEIDPPEDETSVRRREFYVKSGFAENPFEHIHPPYRQGNRGHRLVIMSFPKRLTQNQYEKFNGYLKHKVMEGLDGLA